MPISVIYAVDKHLKHQGQSPVAGQIAQVAAPSEAAAGKEGPGAW